MDEDITTPVSSLIIHLQALLLDINEHPYPMISNPPNCKKRASVALIVRIRPTYPDQPVCSPTEADFRETPFKDTLRSFFRQEWVQRGDPEVLFIRRAARKGDRWTSHVALPGGKRDPSDESDRVTSIRETVEETGLDLAAPHVLQAGNLPERVVTTAWGTVPLMVLCPFVFLLTKFDIPPLRLQPTEVNSAHWVSLRALLSPSLRTYERCDISDRLARQGDWFVRGFLRASLGQMLYAATYLIPSESVFCSSVPGFVPEKAPPSPIGIIKGQIMAPFLTDHAGSSNPGRPLLLWGLTHGIIADFLDLLPAHDTFKLWHWPTLSAPDMRLVIWLVTYRFRKQKLEKLKALIGVRSTIEEGLDILDPSIQQSYIKENFEVEEDGAGFIGAHRSLTKISRSSAVGHMLEGYYRLIRRAVLIAIFLRLGLGSALLGALIRGSRRKC